VSVTSKKRAGKTAPAAKKLRDGQTKQGVVDNVKRKNLGGKWALGG